jgi:hypothetical protein
MDGQMPQANMLRRSTTPLFLPRLFQERLFRERLLRLRRRRRRLRRRRQPPSWLPSERQAALHSWRAEREWQGDLVQTQQVDINDNNNSNNNNNNNNSSSNFSQHILQPMLQRH